MRQFLLSVLPVLLSSENNAEPKQEILCRFCLSTHTGQGDFSQYETIAIKTLQA